MPHQSGGFDFERASGASGVVRVVDGRDHSVRARVDRRNGLAIVSENYRQAGGRGGGRRGARRAVIEGGEIASAPEAFPFRAGMVRSSAPDPPGLVAITVALYSPAAVGVPEMTPDAGSIASPGGSPSAL